MYINIETLIGLDASQKQVEMYSRVVNIGVNKMKDVGKDY